MSIQFDKMAITSTEEGGVPAKAARTMTTLGLLVVGFFWTSGGFYVRAARMYPPDSSPTIPPSPPRRGVDRFTHAKEKDSGCSHYPYHNRPPHRVGTCRAVNLQWMGLTCIC
jgi:hypothetical protein